MSSSPLSRMTHLLGLCLLATALVAPESAFSARVHVESNTILRYFERDTGEEPDAKAIPLYEYLNLSVEDVGIQGISFRAYGWGRHDFGSDYFDNINEGEILYGYLQYSGPYNNLDVRLGRQYVFEGVSNISIDGLRVGGDLSPYFSVSLYGGSPVELEEVNGRSGDQVWGGRISNHISQYYDVGLSYKRVVNDGDSQRENLAVDTSLTPPGPIQLTGFSSRDLVGDRWAEHSYEARFTLGKFFLRPSYHRFVYDGLFNAGKDTGSPFRFLADTEETLTVVGVDANVREVGPLEFGARLNEYDYRERDETAWYYAGLATLHGAKLTQLGAELGRMDGDTADNRYIQMRAHFYLDGQWAGSPTFLSGDFVYDWYDEPILSHDRSSFFSLGGGRRFLDDSLTTKLSVDFSRDPYFGGDVRGMLAVEYKLDR